METKGRPFQPGNKASRGRPKGSRNKMNQEGRQFLQLHTKALVAKALRMAIDGNERVLCHLLTLAFGAKTLPTKIGSLAMRSVDDLVTAFERTAKKVAAGEMTLEHAHFMLEMMTERRELIEAEEIDKRLRAVEKERDKGGQEPPLDLAA
jgi:hypothetical protein